MALRHRLRPALLPLLSCVLFLTNAATARAQSDKPALVNDPFGVAMLFPTAREGRQWRADWEARRTVTPYNVDAQDPLLRNSAGALRIAEGIAASPAGQTRLYVLTPKDKEGEHLAPLWKNVEITAYVRCGEPTQTTDSQALVLSARSGEQHNSRVPCDGTSYHATLRFDGTCGFKKEIWHTGGYTDLRPSPAPRLWSHVPQSEWIGLKFVCRNCDQDQHVRLELYRDLREQNDWQRVADLIDQGGWQGRRAACNRAKDYIITEARPAVYFRTDHVPVEVKKFSVREIDPLP